MVDSLFQAADGPIRSGLLAALKEIWKLDKEVTLSITQGLTFLGIDMVLRKNGDVFLHQERFVDSILEKYSMQGCKGNRCVQIDKLPIDDDVPLMTKLQQLQSYSGEFNWLATRTRPDISYLTSLLASSCTKYAACSDEFAMKIFRYLKDSKAKGILISATRDLTDLKAWTDAGYAGADTKSQSGLIIRWGGSIIAGDRLDRQYQNFLQQERS